MRFTRQVNETSPPTLTPAAAIALTVILILGLILGFLWWTRKKVEDWLLPILVRVRPENQ